MTPSNAIPWHNEYALGIKKIDKQHKHLFELVNRLYALEDDNYCKEALRTILYEFSEYMKTHFKEEEEYMRSIEYPQLQEHIELHTSIIDTLHAAIQTPAKIAILKTKMRVIAKRCLIDHIAQEDIKIKLYAISRINNEKIDEEIFDLV